MKKKNFNTEYWENRYLNKNTGWDLSHISKPLETYFDQLKNKNIKLLIPGAGNSHEAEYLWNNGFKNVYILDIAKKPLDEFLIRNPKFPQKNCLQMNYFDLVGQFDLIIEQTFFCALNPHLRTNYVNKTRSLLKKEGELAGLLFNIPLTDIGPPFGGDKNIYENYFKSNFKIKTLENAYNSEESRKDKELFFIFEKK